MPSPNCNSANLLIVSAEILSPKYSPSPKNIRIIIASPPEVRTRAKKRLIWRETVDQRRNFFGKPLVSNLILDTMPPTGIRVLAACSSPRRCDPRFANTMRKMRLHTKLSRDFCRSHGRMNDEQLNREPSRSLLKIIGFLILSHLHLLIRNHTVCNAIPNTRVFQ